MVRLWVHEITRVFSDRLISIDDRLIILNLLREETRVSFNLNFDNVFAHLNSENDVDKTVNTIDKIRLFLLDKKSITINNFS